jgi:hypothetical protein
MGVRRNTSRFISVVISVVITAGVVTACSTNNPPAAAPPATVPAKQASNSVTPSSDDADQLALRNLYNQLVDALGHHDTAAQVDLTCARYQDDAARQAEKDAMLNIEFFGPIEQVRQVGRDAATEKLYAALLPASKQAVEAVVDAIIDDDLPRYHSAIKRLEQEGTTTTPVKIDAIDTATVTGNYTMRAFTSPPKVIARTNQAVRENGQWKDCTPPTH